MTLHNVEGHSAVGEGIDLFTKTAVAVEQSWLHNNYKGNIVSVDAVQITSQHNVVERAGLRASDDLLVNSSANGIRVDNDSDGDASTALVQNADIVRNNVANGVRIGGRDGSVLPIDTSWCGNGGDGLATSNFGVGSHPGSVLGLGGDTAAYNQSNGADVRIDASSSVTLNNESSFPSNNLCGLYNGSAGTTVDATVNQWRGTPPYQDTCPSGSPGGPAPGQIDTNFPVDHVNAAVSVNATSPTNVILKGQTIRISGNGFNSIDGNPPAGAGGCTTGYNGSGSGGQAGSCCNKTDRSNKCDSLHDPGTIANGHCVEFGDSLNGWASLAVRSVTPRLLEAEVTSTALRCLGGSTAEVVQVTKRISTTTKVEGFTPYCINPN